MLRLGHQTSEYVVVVYLMKLQLTRIFGGRRTISTFMEELPVIHSRSKAIIYLTLSSCWSEYCADTFVRPRSRMKPLTATMYY